MDIRYFIGVDISKATLDWAVFDGKTIVLQSQSQNSEAGIKTTLKLIKALPDFTIANSVCCMEHTATADRGDLQRPHTELFTQDFSTHLVREQFTNQKVRRSATGQK